MERTVFAYGTVHKAQMLKEDHTPLLIQTIQDLIPSRVSKKMKRNERETDKEILLTWNHPE